MARRLLVKAGEEEVARGVRVAVWAPEAPGRSREQTVLRAGCSRRVAKAPAEEVKVSPQEDKPQKTILCMICAFSLAFSFFLFFSPSPPFFLQKAEGEKGE